MYMFIDGFSSIIGSMRLKVCLKFSKWEFGSLVALIGHLCVFGSITQFLSPSSMKRCFSSPFLGTPLAKKL